MRWILLILIYFNCYIYAQAEEANASDSATENRTINLATNISSAFTSDFPSGSTQDLLPHLQCIFKRMGRAYDVQVMPWRRAYQDVKSNRIDGFFTAVRRQCNKPVSRLIRSGLLRGGYGRLHSAVILTRRQYASTPPRAVRAFARAFAGGTGRGARYRTVDAIAGSRPL